MGGVAIPGGGGTRVRGVVGRWGKVLGSGGGGWGSVGGGGGVVVVVGVLLGVEVVVVVGVLVVVVVVVVELVVLVVLGACPHDPLAVRWDMVVGHRLQPLGPHGFMDSWGEFGAGLGGDRGGGVLVPGLVWPAVVGVCGGWMFGRLEMGMWLRVWMGSCCVAASVVAVRAWGRGAWDAVGV